jgi:5-methylcytosine-specific restriction endonuclease McrBC regulatory subunit McrC
MRLDGVGDLRHEDLRVGTDLRTSYYRDAIALARNIIVNRGRQLDSGDASVWTFLFRTPEPVEQGVRAVLGGRLAPQCTVTKTALSLPPSSKTLNPDLVFDGGDAVADVKYKIAGADWVRSDLYQAVAFATGYRTERAAIVTFGDPHSALAPLQVGDVTVTHLLWPNDARVAPAEAADTLAIQVASWLAA